MKALMKKYIYYIYICKIPEDSVFNCRVVRGLQKHVHSSQVNYSYNYSYEYSSLYPLSTVPWFAYLCFQNLTQPWNFSFCMNWIYVLLSQRLPCRRLPLADCILWSNLEQNIRLSVLEAAVRAESNVLGLVDQVKTEALADISKSSPSQTVFTRYHEYRPSKSWVN